MTGAGETPPPGGDVLATVIRRALVDRGYGTWDDISPSEAEALASVIRGYLAAEAADKTAASRRRTREALDELVRLGEESGAYDDDFGTSGPSPS